MKKAVFVTAAVMLVTVPGRADVESLNLANYRPGVDRAVEKALGFLASRMATGGSFTDKVKNLNAVAGLAGMAFLSVGHTPGCGSYGDVVNSCIDFILSTPSDGPHGGAAKGWLGRTDIDRMYGHAIATLFLSEVSGMVDPERQKKIDVLLPKALKVILDAQAVQKEERYAGGWRYLPDSPDSDLSISGWNLMALRSARLNGAPVPAEAIKKAIEFVNRCYNGGTGHRGPEPSTWHNWPSFNYQAGTVSAPHNAHGPSAVGLFCRELCGYHDDEINRRCAGFVMGWAGQSLQGATSPDRHSANEYITYYASNAMFQLGGRYWEQFAPRLFTHLITHQRDDGSWNAPSAAVYGQVYSTSMYVLSLTVSYRQLPIYQR